MAGTVGTRRPIGGRVLGLGTVLLAVVACGRAMTRRRFDVDLYRACLESRGYRRVPVTREEG